MSALSLEVSVPPAVAGVSARAVAALEADHYETLPIGLVTVDRRLQVRRANAQGRRLLGAGLRGATPGRRLLDRLSAKDRDHLIAALRSCGDSRGLSCGEITLGTPGLRPRVVRVDAQAQPGGDEVLLAFVDVTAARLRTERAEQQALHDPLTGLPNRVLALQRLEGALGEAARDGARVGAMFIDLDHFKGLNDSLGHEAGDQLLCEVAARLRAALGDTGLPARLGGDEFLAVLPHLGSGDDAMGIAARLLEALTQPWRYGAHDWRPAASIGVGLYPDDAVDGAGLLRAADRALYRAKREGRQGVRRFDPGLDGDGSQAPAAVARLREALHRQELCLHYQPQLALRDGALRGLGALLRWEHPVQGLLEPGSFLPVAEEWGLAPGLGAWVLDEAAGQWQRWHALGLAPPRLSVKLSSRQLAQPGLDALVDEVVRRRGMPAQALQLEVADQVLAVAEPFAVDTLVALRDRGIGLALDRFGAGASSLSRLSQVLPQLLRVDPGVIRGLPGDGSSRAVVEAAVAIARALGVRVLADGVETAGQRNCLADCGVDEGQGPLLGLPAPPAEVMHRLGGTAAPAVPPGQRG